MLKWGLRVVKKNCFLHGIAACPWTSNGPEEARHVRSCPGFSGNATVLFWGVFVFEIVHQRKMPVLPEQSKGVSWDSYAELRQARSTERIHFLSPMMRKNILHACMVRGRIDDQNGAWLLILIVKLVKTNREIPFVGKNVELEDNNHTEISLSHLCVELCSAKYFSVGKNSPVKHSCSNSFQDVSFPWSVFCGDGHDSDDHGRNMTPSTELM